MIQKLLEKMVSLPTYQQDRFGDLEPSRGDNVPHWIKWSDLDAIIEEYKATEQEPVAKVIHDGSFDGVMHVRITNYQALQHGMDLFTHPPLSDETVKDAERISDLLIEARSEISECLDDYCNMMETKPNRPAIWKQLLSDIDEAMKAERETTKG